MSLVKTLGPVWNYYVGPGPTYYQSKVANVGNPIVYDFTRKDFTFNSIADNGGLVQFVINGSDQTASFVVGDTVFVKDNGGIYEFSAAVTASSFAVNTYVTVNYTFTAVASVGYANLISRRPQYRIEVEFINPTTGKNLDPNVYQWTPNAKGYVKIDVSGIVGQYVSPDINDSLSSGGTVTTDSGAWTKFYIKYKEVWKGSANSYTNDGDQVIAKVGADQFIMMTGERHTKQEWVIYDKTAGAPPNLGSLISQYKTYWRNRGNQSVSYYLENGTNVWMKFETFLNGVSTGTYEIQLSTGLGRVIFGYNELPTIATADYINIWVYNKTTPVVLSNVQKMTIKDPCTTDVKILGRNSHGGDLYWLFDSYYEYVYEYSNGQKAKRLSMSTTVTETEWEMLSNLITDGETYSVPQVFGQTTTKRRIGSQVYIIMDSYYKIPVTVIPNKNKTSSMFKRKTFELEVELPEYFQ